MPPRADFSRRSGEAEWMDGECGWEAFRDCLADLARVNVLTLTHRPVLAFLDRLARAGRLPVGRPVAIIDAGSGYGDLLRLVDRWAERRGLAVSLTGVDLNPWSARAAAAATAPGRPIRWVTADLFAYHPPGPVDLIISSQVTHHLDDAALVRFLRWMEATAGLGWFVADLHRHPIPYHVFRLWARAAGWHPMVAHDGPISIARAFVRADWRRALEVAGLAGSGVRVRWHVPFRFSVSRVKPT